MRINGRGIWKVATIALLGIILVLVSCLDEIDPELGQEYERLLVVEGDINQGTGKVEVTLSYTSSAGLPVFRPALQFEVTVSDDQGNQVELMHAGNGRYISPNEDYEAFSGRKYKMFLTSLETGDQYESTWESLPEPVPIDSVYTSIEYREEADVNHTINGLQFYLNTGDFKQDSTYFRWELTETWKYSANYVVNFIYNGQIKSSDIYDSLFTCYKTEQIKELFSRGTADLEGNNLNAFPLHYVSTETGRLKRRYSLLVHQKVISKKAYEFWSDVGKLTSNEATLFVAQPFQVEGNVVNVNDLNEPVLGYFSASAVSEKRIFLNKPTSLDFYDALFCSLITEDLLAALSSYSGLLPVYLTGQSVGGITVPAFPPNQSCIDCRKKGGQVDPPEFWIEE